MKKNIFILICAAGFSFILNAGHCSNIHNDSVIYEDGAVEISLTVQEKSSLIDKYLRSIIPGLLVGGGIGAISGFFDRIAPDFWALTWFVSFWQRRNLVDDISVDMQRHNLPHHKSLMELSSFIATWLVWYKTFYDMHGCKPL